MCTKFWWSYNVKGKDPLDILLAKSQYPYRMLKEFQEHQYQICNMDIVSSLKLNISQIFLIKKCLASPLLLFRCLLFFGLSNSNSHYVV